ncbi:lysosome-associated membrane glycoprotein 1-like isoform X2 [Amphiura filiformis]|uniref:lysosome-associated membrane glycoprotein 1-like isoform X2 n=1 Tax=Amphiura filiformis TaxID=82378 RepID=UPI003B21F5D7
MKYMALAFFAAIVGMVSSQGQTQWQVAFTNGTVCIIAQLDADLSVMYTKNDSSMGNATVNLPETATVDTSNSKCGSTTDPAVLVLVFGPNYLRHEFTLKDKTYSVSRVEASFLHDATLFPDSQQAGMNVTYTGVPSDPVFQSTSDMAYKCNSGEFSQLNGTIWNVTYSNVKVQPFGVVNDTFSQENECAADQATTTVMTTSMNATTGMTTAMNSTTVMTTITTMMPTTVMPPAGDWTFADANGTCLNMTFSAKFSIKYWMTTNKENTSEVNLPKEASPTLSTCNSTDANFTLTFFDDWSLSMIFHRPDNQTKNSYTTTNYTLTYVMDDHFLNPVLAGQKIMVFSENTGIEADNGKYYKCDSTVKVKADNATTNFSEMELQPFAQDAKNNGTRGGSFTECPADSEISNIVPIAVGCALAGLVIIVLIAYLIGRSRSSRQGYQSV